MNDNKFFSISGVACVAHTPETRKLWHSIEGCKSDWGKDAIITYAEKFGYSSEKKEVNEALNFLLDQFNNMFGAKSHVIRKAIINYS
jgi:hypothetical protein